MPEEMPLFPLNTVLFPGMPLPLHIFEPRYREMIAVCSRDERPFGVVLIKDGQEVGEAAEPFTVGTMARIVGVDRLPDGRLNIMTIGTQRFRLLEHFADRKSYLVGEVEPLKDDSTPTEVLQELAKEVGTLGQRYAALVQTASEHDLVPLQLPGDAEEISYTIGAGLHIRNEERQHLLELVSTTARLGAEKQILQREIQLIEELLKHRKSGNSGSFSRN
jgi:Lon protease-like protein